MYGSDPFAHDFEATLKAATTIETSGEGLTAEQVYWRKHFSQAPTEEALRKDAKRFGGEGVSEIAEAYGMTALAVELAEDNGTRKRRTSNTMREQVRALQARGVIPAAIADTLNISDRRVRQLLAEPLEIAA